MYKLIVMPGMVIEDMDQFLENHVQGDDETAAGIREAYRYIERHTPNFVMVESLDELTESEEMELYHVMKQVGGFESMTGYLH
ncbi:hypothetical protein [Halobacillus karajensis]|uniref:Uncharacterized protein n=1 Tax=Halobacillus karajensis TaxID=195088 RepID=A0A024P7M8_9BACI|nr:hypothetical protein [Halobacillus karajensis]CDQ20986.1 hypothetical protein BN982_03347 [Halobacillus karajensis]CDQ24950.1 hypothetical protein BN983_03251 [Halobacillus karajensis]CDQ28689.1 hypothetical protein BN981_03002 [Halobacillus karajensis]